MIQSTAEEVLMQQCFLSKAWGGNLVLDWFLITLGVTVLGTE